MHRSYEMTRNWLLESGISVSNSSDQNHGGVHSFFDENKNEIYRVECTKPIVLRSDIMHTVEMGKDAKYPRIQFSFCFYNEPLHLLK